MTSHRARIHRISTQISASILAIGLASASAFAQDASNLKDPDAEEIVVTGSVGAIKKIDSTNTINTFDQKDIQ